MADLSSFLDHRNYSVVLNAAVMFFAAVSWFAYGKGRYTGEIPEVPANGLAVISGEELVHEPSPASKFGDVKQFE